MTGHAAPDPAAAHQAEVDKIWRLLDDGHRLVVVNSPPGAGKSTLVQDTARRIATAGQVPIITQTNDQADDLVKNLSQVLARKDLSAGRLHREGYTPPPGVPASRSIDDLQDCDIVVAPADKWAFVSQDHTWSLGIIDEAYQVSSAHLVRIAARFDRLLLVGDPGQLNPFTTVDEAALRATGSWPLDTAAGTVLRTHPQTPTVQLPVSWRLSSSGARVVSDSFYNQPFESAAAKAERGLWFPPRTLNDPIDSALAVASEHGWCHLELPGTRLPRTDPECMHAISTLVERLLISRAQVSDGVDIRALQPRDIAVGVTHRDQRARLRETINSMCAAHSLREDVTVETANRLQGRQFEVVIAWHPLSGRRDASAFHLEAGRLCVLASRHRQACVVVSRDGIREQLDAYPHSEPLWLGAAAPEVDGWEANHRFLQHLEPMKVLLSA